MKPGFKSFPHGSIAKVALAAVLSFFAAFVLSASPAASASVSRLYVPPIPKDLNAVDLYLLTAGVGDEIANRFGHTGIRIYDRRTGSDVVFNWGKFSFDAPGFAWKFFRGSLTYSMGVRTFKNDVAVYAESDRRLVMDRLQLTNNQKLELIRKIQWNARPENREFAYQYWFKNCSTIPRDYLNEVLHGQIEAQFASKPAGRVFRDYVRQNLAFVPFLVPLLDTLMNGNIDRGITLWEDMFLPARLRDVLREMPAVNDAGEPLVGSKLLVDDVVLVDAPEDFSSPFPDYAVLLIPVWLPIVALGLSMALARRKILSAKQDDYRVFAIKSLGVGAIYWGGLSGIIGLTLLLNWGFSGHPDGWANPNLMFIWPLDFALIPIGWRLLKSGKPLKDRWPWPGAGKAYIVAKACGVGGLFLLHLVGVVQQDVTRVATAFGGASLALTFGLWMHGFARHVAVAHQAVKESGDGWSSSRRFREATPKRQRRPVL